MQLKFGKKYEVWYDGEKHIMICRQDPDEHALFFVEGKPDKNNPVPPLLIKVLEDENYTDEVK